LQVTSSSTITNSSRVISTHIVHEPSMVTSHLRSKQLRKTFSSRFLFVMLILSRHFWGFGVNKALKSKHIFITGINNNNNNNNNKTIALGAILKNF